MEIKSLITLRSSPIIAKSVFTIVPLLSGMAYCDSTVLNRPAQRCA